MANLAQLNIARMKVAPDDPAFSRFTDALDPVNQIADESPGFVWRLKSDDADSLPLAEFEAKGWLVNMSVWQSLDHLRGFIRSPMHLSIMRRRAEWFEKSEVYMCLWWIPEGHTPDFEEAMETLEYLRLNGPTARAFTFSSFFEPE